MRIQTVSRTMSRTTFVCLQALLLIAGACAAQDDSGADSGVSPAAGTRVAQAAPPASEGALPPGHPAVSTPRAATDALPPVPAGAGTGAAALTWEVPAGWVSETPQSSMRRAQYRVPGTDGDGQAVVFYFGPGQGGTAEANAARWAGQMAQPDGRGGREAMHTENLAVGTIQVLWVEVTGTYNGGMAMGTPKPLEDAMLLGAIVQGADANWFFKVTGPRTTLEPQRDAFRAMIRSLRPGPASSP